MASTPRSPNRTTRTIWRPSPGRGPGRDAGCASAALRAGRRPSPAPPRAVDDRRGSGRRRAEPRRTVSRVSPFFRVTSRSSMIGSARAARAWRVGDVLGDDADLDAGEGRVGDAGIAERVAEAAGWPSGAREHQLRPAIGTAARRPASSAARRSSSRMAATSSSVRVGARLDSDGGEVALDHRDVRVGDFRRRLGT